MESRIEITTPQSHSKPKIFNSLKSFSKLELTDDDIDNLCAYLVKTPALTHLDLSCNSITDEGAIRLCEFLKSQPHIQTLDISDNQIDFAGMKALAENKTLNSLNVWGNKGIKFEFALSQYWF